GGAERLAAASFRGPARLVGLFAAQEVELVQAAVDAILDGQAEQHRARAEVCPRGIETALEVEEAAARFQTVECRDGVLMLAQQVEARCAARGQRDRRLTVKAAQLWRLKQAAAVLLRPAQIVQAKQIRHAGAHRLRGGGLHQS